MFEIRNEYISLENSLPSNETLDPLLSHSDLYKDVFINIIIINNYLSNLVEIVTESIEKIATCSL